MLLGEETMVSVLLMSPVLEGLKVGMKNDAFWINCCAHTGLTRRWRLQTGVGEGAEQPSSILARTECTSEAFPALTVLLSHNTGYKNSHGLIKRSYSFHCCQSCRHMIGRAGVCVCDRKIWNDFVKMLSCASPLLKATIKRCIMQLINGKWLGHI